MSSSSPSKMKGKKPVCRCKEESPMQVAQTDTGNYGRRFYGCANWQTHKCRFFKWVDEPFSERAVEVIDELRGEIDDLKGTGHKPSKVAAEKKKIELKVSGLVEEKAALELKIKEFCIDVGNLEQSFNDLVAENKKLKLGNDRLKKKCKKIAVENENLKRLLGLFVVILLWALWKRA